MLGFANLLAGEPFPVHRYEVAEDPDLLTTRRYVLLLPTFSPDRQTRLSGSYAPRLVSIVAHCYARSADEAGWLADRVDEVVRPRGFGVVPVVEGRKCDPVTRAAHFGPEREDAGSLWDAFHEYQFMSYPA